MTNCEATLSDSAVFEKAIQTMKSKQEHFDAVTEAYGALTQIDTRTTKSMLPAFGTFTSRVNNYFTCYKLEAPLDEYDRQIVDLIANVLDSKFGLVPRPSRRLHLEHYLATFRELTTEAYYGPSQTADPSLGRPDVKYRGL